MDDVPHSAAGGRIARSYAWTIVALRVPIVLAWIAALIAALVLLPWLSGSSSAPLDDIVPAAAEGAGRAGARAPALRLDRLDRHASSSTATRAG